MKIQEIIAGGAFPASYTQHELELTATYCRNNAIKTVPLENGEYEIVVCKDGSFGLFRRDSFIGYASIADETIGNVLYGSLKLIYLVPEARKTKAFLIFVNALRHLVSKPILVDGAMFNDGAAALNAMSKRNLFVVKVLDKHTGSEVPYTGIIPYGHDKAIVVEGIDFPLGDYYPLPGMSPTSHYCSFLWFD